MITKLLQWAVDAFARKFLTRRFALFLVPWLIIIAVPSLRLMWSSQLRDGVGVGELLPIDAAWTGDERWTYAGQRLAAHFPNDFNAQVLAASENTVSTPGFSAFDELIERYPEQTWLIAERLLRTNLRRDLKMTSSAQAARMGAPGPIVTPPQMPLPNQAIPLNLKRAMEVAELGRRREPQNAFYDWKLVECLLLARREPQAIAALRQAVSKPYYDTHRRDWVLARLGALELEHPLLFEAKIQTLQREMELKWDFESYAHLMWFARKLQRQGNHARALELFGDVMKLTAKQVENRDGIAAPRRPTDVWKQALTDTKFGQARPPRLSQRGVYHKFWAEQFAKYAKSHGRADLGVAALDVSKAMIRTEQRLTSSYTSLWGYGDVVPAVVQERILIASIASAGIGFLIFILIGLRWAVFFPLWIPGLTGDQPRRRDLWLTSSVYILLTAGIVGFVLWPRPVLYGNPGSSIFLELVFDVALRIYPLLLLLSPTLCAAVTVWRNRKTVYARPEPAENTAMVPRSYFPIFLTLVSWFVLIGAVACWIAAPIVFRQPLNSITVPLPPVLVQSPVQTTASIHFGFIVIAGVVLSLISYVGWLIRWRWMAPRALKPIAHYAIRWHLKSLGDWMIILSFAYLIVLTWSLWPRGEAEAGLYRFLEQGVVASAEVGKGP